MTMSLTVHLALVFHVFIAVAAKVMVQGRRGLWPSWYRRYGITQCYLPPDTGERAHLNPSQ